MHVCTEFATGRLQNGFGKSDSPSRRGEHNEDERCTIASRRQCLVAPERENSSDLLPAATAAQNSSIMSDTFCPIIMLGALELPPINLGTTDGPAKRSLSMRRSSALSDQQRP